ncbi:selenoneine synthase SenA [Ramlibacter albus]|uniref:Ergothioneine biosynthesis protein EgtB n=1 Tax=Ramlibacter albus TaxID=2079448 RepID=A0A923S1S5_9BURK|nr:selenoneine synthase SenA [Ramlibacter albus]MBC5764003.1 ergothioneine biosynthesis protein EgtB [Ramlibacter albus]
MDDPSSRVYNAAHALRTGGPAQVRAALLRARERTELLSLAYEEALGPQLPVPLRATLNPPLWELGHVGWFQEYWLGRNPQRGQGAAWLELERPPSMLRNADSLYDSSNVPHDTRWHLPLPDLQATRGYLAQVLAQTLELLDRLPPDASEDDLYFFRLCTLHEEMHAEAAVYMARALGIAVPPQVLCQRERGQEGALRVEERTFRIGWAGAGFAFDNELHAHEVHLPAFEIDARPVSWARYMGFVEAGGYRERRLWDDAGAQWLDATGAKDREAGIRSRAGEPQAPAVHLTAHEARAWCRWAGLRLPTEAEWECAALHAPGFAWGEVWEWTASAFTPYPGFQPHPYRDYSAPWFGTRVVLRGACTATSQALAHPRYRNFFEPHRTDILAGFRSAVTSAGR